MDIERLAALPLCKLFRLRSVMRSRGNAYMVDQVSKAIGRRYELFRLGEIS
jgi:hypothetical protein